MDFEDFCHYFTDVVVCRLVERTLLWPGSHWREERLYGDWAAAPSPDTFPHIPHSSKTKQSGTEQRGDRKEARLWEKQQTEGRRGGSEWDKTVENSTKEADGGEEGESEAQMSKRSRCGGCINHRDTFLHNPQVKPKTNCLWFGTKIQLLWFLAVRVEN